MTEKMIFPQYINTNERTVSVNGVMKENDSSKDYEDGKGYINDKDEIWIYAEKKPSTTVVNAYPYFWFNEDGKKEYSDPSELMRNIFKIESLQDISILNIIEKTDPNEQLYNEAEILDISASANFYIPIINKDDDFLKKIVKLIIIEKGIDINRLKSKTEMPYILPNMKTALQNKTKMSVSYFTAWMELMGCSFDVVIKDNGTDTVNPLKQPYVYDTETDSMSVIINGKEIKLDTDKYYKTNVTDDEE